MSLDIIPIDLYTSLYFHILFLVTLFTFWELKNAGIRKSQLGYLLLWFTVFYIGLRPVSGVFVDMLNYATQFESLQSGRPNDSDKDIGFVFFISRMARFASLNFFFLTCAFLYVFPVYLACKKWFQEYWFYGFLLIIGSFSFWAYGTNGIRNGLAGSFFLFGLSRDRRIWQIVFILISISFHKSMILPTLGFTIAQVYNKPKILVGFWLLCIPLSIIGGGFWESFFSSLGFGDDRLSYLTEGNVNDDDFSSTGFRWDFLAYSGIGAYAGWYFIILKGFKDKIYFWIFNTYIFSNSFWILVIRANFSNRFAYLSWFMIAPVVIYPFLKQKNVNNRSHKLALVLLLYFSFTYLMNVVIIQK
jgi:hypothetical protein